MQQIQMKPQIQQQYRQLKFKVQDEIRQLQQKLSSNSEIHYHRSITGGSSRYLQQPVSVDEEYRQNNHVIRINNTVMENRALSSNDCHSRSHSHCHHHHSHNHHCASTTSSRCIHHSHINDEDKCSRRSSCSINNNNYQPNRLYVDNNVKRNQKVLEQSNLLNLNTMMNTSNSINQKLLEQNLMLQKAYIKSVQQHQSLSSNIRLLQDKISRLQFQSSQIIDNHIHETPTSRSSKRSNSYQFKILSLEQLSNQYRNDDQSRKSKQQQGYHKPNLYQYEDNDNNSIQINNNANSRNKLKTQDHNNTNRGGQNYNNNNKFQHFNLKQQSRKYQKHQNQHISNNHSINKNHKSKFKPINNQTLSKKSSKSNSILSSKNKSINHYTSQSKSKSKLNNKLNIKNKQIIPQSDVSQQYMIPKIKSQNKFKYNTNNPSNKNERLSKGYQNNCWHNDYFGYDKLCPVHIDPKMFKLNSKQKQVYKDSNYRNRKHQRDHLIQSYKQQQIARKKLIDKILNHKNK